MSVTNGTGTADPTEAPECTLVFFVGMCCPIFRFFCGFLFDLLSFFFGDCIVGPSLIYGFWLPLSFLFFLLSRSRVVFFLLQFYNWFQLLKNTVWTGQKYTFEMCCRCFQLFFIDHWIISAHYTWRVFLFYFMFDWCCII